MVEGGELDVVMMAMDGGRVWMNILEMQESGMSMGEILWIIPRKIGKI